MRGKENEDDAHILTTHMRNTKLKENTPHTHLMDTRHNCSQESGSAQCLNQFINLFCLFFDTLLLLLSFFFASKNCLTVDHQIEIIHFMRAKGWDDGRRRGRTFETTDMSRLNQVWFPSEKPSSVHLFLTIKDCQLLLRRRFHVVARLCVTT